LSPEEFVFQFFKEPKIDFMGKLKLWVGISIALVVASVIMLVSKGGVKRGIEFSGGTELQVKYAQPPDLGMIRSALTNAGLSNHLVTTIGRPDENEVYIRLTAGASAGKESDVTEQVVRALKRDKAGRSIDSSLTDLNWANEATLRALLETSPELSREDAAKIAGAITAGRKEVAIFRSLDEISTISGVTPQALDHLKKRCFTGPFAIRSQSYIGPIVGRELLTQAGWAILGSLAGMLVYLWIRFQFQWGMAAVIALMHDTIITLGLFTLFGKEMSLPVVAAFLTLIGYSVNDTVVVFDRVRENLRARAGQDLERVLNDSINQTLSRTIITSGLTWITVLSIFLLGGEALNPFSFVLTVGIVIGTYSSIYIAIPVLVIWRRFFQRKTDAKTPSKATPATKAAKKVRSRTA